jgi:flagellin-like hook-associated protein FlgL
MNGDGRADLITGDATNNRIEGGLSNGDGSFTLFSTAAASASATIYSISAADVDGDDDSDLLVGNQMGHSFSVYLNNGAGSISHAQTVGSSNHWWQVVEDIDGDDDLDLVASTLDSVSVYENNDGVFSLSAFLNRGDGGNGAFNLDVADMDNDGDKDIVAINHFGTADIGLRWNNDGTGTFSALTTFSISTSGAVQGLIAQDMNDDEAPDLLFWNSTGTGLRQQIQNSQMVSTVNCDITELNVRSSENASSVLELLDEGLEKISSRRTEIGSSKNSLDFASLIGTRQHGVLEEVASNTNSVDLAQEMVELTKQQVLQQARVAAWSQANLSQRTALELWSSGALAFSGFLSSW